MLTINLNNTETNFSTKIIVNPFGERHTKVRLEYPGGLSKEYRLPLSRNPLTEKTLNCREGMEEKKIHFVYHPDLEHQAWEIMAPLTHPQFKEITDFIYNL